MKKTPVVLILLVAVVCMYFFVGNFFHTASSINFSGADPFSVTNKLRLNIEEAASHLSMPIQDQAGNTYRTLQSNALTVKLLQSKEPQDIQELAIDATITGERMNAFVQIPCAGCEDQFFNREDSIRVPLYLSALNAPDMQMHTMEQDGNIHVYTQAKKLEEVVPTQLSDMTNQELVYMSPEIQNTYDFRKLLKPESYFSDIYSSESHSVPARLGAPSSLFLYGQDEIRFEYDLVQVSSNNITEWSIQLRSLDGSVLETQGINENIIVSGAGTNRMRLQHVFSLPKPDVYVLYIVGPTSEAVRLEHIVVNTNLLALHTGTLVGPSVVQVRLQEQQNMYVQQLDYTSNALLTHISGQPVTPIAVLNYFTNSLHRITARQAGTHTIQFTNTVAIEDDFVLLGDTATNWSPWSIPLQFNRTDSATSAVVTSLLQNREKYSAITIYNEFLTHLQLAEDASEDRVLYPLSSKIITEPAHTDSVSSYINTGVYINHADVCNSRLFVHAQRAVINTNDITCDADKVVIPPSYGPAVTQEGSVRYDFSPYQVDQSTRITRAVEMRGRQVYAFLANPHSTVDFHMQLEYMQSSQPELSGAHIYVYDSVGNIVYMNRMDTQLREHQFSVQNTADLIEQYTLVIQPQYTGIVVRSVTSNTDKFVHIGGYTAPNRMLVYKQFEKSEVVKYVAGGKSISYTVNEQAGQLQGSDKQLFFPGAYTFDMPKDSFIGGSVAFEPAGWFAAVNIFIEPRLVFAPTNNVPHIRLYHLNYRAE